jgi:tetratricopeptide (TPR) repeat protein
MPGTLEIIDPSRWRSEREYSESVSFALSSAYQQIKHQQGTVISYARVLTTLEPWVHVRMAAPQRERLYFLLGSAHGALNDYAGAAEYLGFALDLAASRGEMDNMAHLLSLRGMMYRATGRWAAGSADLQECLVGLPESHILRPQHDLGFRLRALRQYADYEFFAAHFDTSAAALREAQALMPYIIEQDLEKASCRWAEARLLRQARQPKAALHLALGVVDTFTAEANPATRVRFHLFLANTALDVLETTNLELHSTAYQMYLAHAHEQISLALSLARTTGDVPGEYVVQLAEARHDRLANRKVNRLAAIEVIARAGQWLRDDGLVAQSLTALGDEFVSRNEVQTAINLYRQAIGVLDGSEASYYGLAPLRKLLLAEEWRMDD